MFWIDYPFQFPSPGLKKNLRLDKLIHYCTLVEPVAIFFDFAPDFDLNNI